jgi:hypothetical protein
MMIVVGIVASLRTRDGTSIVGLADPSGGTFDSAGDFDRLLGADPSLGVWSSIDPFGRTVVGPGASSALLAELDQIEVQAEPGPEQRGVARLRVLAEQCAGDRSLQLHFAGD